MGDFGIAKVLECTMACARTQIGTPYYLSPELCQERPYSSPADIWAMGCILFEMCALKVPFDADSIPKLVNNITKGKIPEAPKTYSTFMQQLVAEMLVRDPNKRPGCDEILLKPEIQAVVRSMVDEAEEKEGIDAGRNASPRAAPAPIEGLYKDSAGNYKKDDPIQYLSTAHKSWLDGKIIDVAPNGWILIDLKPNTWIPTDLQATNVRPRGAMGVLNRAAADIRQNSPANRAASPMHQRAPSPANRAASREGTPRCNPPWNGGPPSSRDGAPGSRGASPLHRSPSGNNIAQPMTPRSAAGNHRVGDLIEFWSNSHKDWLPAQVTDTDANGRILIDLKPNTWISKDEQSQKVRPRRSGGAYERPSSGNRRPQLPQVGGSPQLPRPPLHRSPSWGAADNRAPSPAGRERTPLRAPSPSGRAQTPVRAASPSGRNGSGRTPSPQAGYCPGMYSNPNRPPRVAQSPLRVGGAAIAGQ